MGNHKRKTQWLQVVGTVVLILNFLRWKESSVVVLISCLGFIAIHSWPLVIVISCN